MSLSNVFSHITCLGITLWHTPKTAHFWGFKNKLAQVGMSQTDNESVNDRNNSLLLFTRLNWVEEGDSEGVTLP